MFTGLIESVCKVGSAIGNAQGMKLQLDIGKDVKIGDSVAINGVCLTVNRLQGNIAQFDVSSETVSTTTIKNLKPSSYVNIERAMSIGDRIGGHFVQGHIDAIGKLKKIEKKGEFWQFIFEGSKEIKNFLIPKGSIAIDGVSLTIADAADSTFNIAVIPTTYENTIMRYYKVGDLVNIETDILCRIVKKQLENIMPHNSNLTIDKMKDIGF